MCKTELILSVYAQPPPLDYTGIPVNLEIIQS